MLIRFNMLIILLVPELNVNMREIHLVEVIYCEDTQRGHQLEVNNNTRFLKAKKIVHHTILLGVEGSIYTSHTLNKLKEPGLIQKKPIRLPPNYLLILCSMHTN